MCLKKVGKKILLHPWNPDSQFLLSVCSWDKAQTHCCCVLIPGPSRKQAGGAVTSCGSITVVLMTTLALLSTSRLGPVRLAFSGSKSQNFFFCADTQKYREKNWRQLTRSLFIPSFSSWHIQSNKFFGAKSPKFHVNPPIGTITRHGEDNLGRVCSVPFPSKVLPDASVRLDVKQYRSGNSLWKGNFAVTPAVPVHSVCRVKNIPGWYSITSESIAEST